MKKNEQKDRDKIIEKSKKKKLFPIVEGLSENITAAIEKSFEFGVDTGLQLSSGISLADIKPEMHPRYIEGKGIYVPIIDIILDMKDYDGGKEMTWDKAKDLSLSKQQWFIILYFRDEINALLKEHGGQELEGWYWTSTQSSQNYAWSVLTLSSYCYTSNDYKSNYFTVRAFSAYQKP